MIAVIRYVYLSTFVHAHTSWVPYLPVRFSPCAELVEKATIGVKNLKKRLK